MTYKTLFYTHGYTERDDDDTDCLVGPPTPICRGTEVSIVRTDRGRILVREDRVGSAPVFAWMDAGDVEVAQ